jgi:hypothetical protein
MYFELWGESLDGFCKLFDKEDIMMRAYLEDHMIIEGVDVADKCILTNVYAREMLLSNRAIDPVDCVFKISKDWFSVVRCNDVYVELVDCIVFDCKKEKFESLLDAYSDCVEKYIDTYDEDLNLVTYSEGDFNIVKEVEVNAGSQLFLVRSDYYEEYVYTVKNSSSFLIVRDYLSYGVSKGLVLGEEEFGEYLRNLGI